MRKALLACNACGALEEVGVGMLGQTTPDGWFKVQTSWPGDLPVSQSTEERIVCSPKCFPALVDVTAEAAVTAAAIAEERANRFGGF